MTSAGVLNSAQGSRFQTAVAVLSFSCVTLLIIAPRATAAVTIGLVVVLAIARATRALPGLTVTILPPLVPLLGFGAWALISTVWSPIPQSTIGKALGLLGLVFLAIATWQAIKLLPRWQIKIAAPYLLWTFIALLVISAIESITDQLLTRTALSLFPMLQDPKHVRVEGGAVAFVSETNINRRTGLAVILLWPAVVLAVTRSGREKTAALSIIAASSIAIMIWSGHQSSQLGLAVSAVTLTVAAISPRTVRILSCLAWAGLALFMVPIVSLLAARGLDNDPHLFGSARHRVVIWTNTVKAIEKAPIRGVGADATAYITLLSERTAQLTRSRAGYTESTARHAHNIFLQNWYELGAVGALLYGAAGLGLIALTAWLPANLQRFGLAQFAATTGMFTFSYSLWQMWVLCGIVLSVVLLAIALRLHEPARPDHDMI